MRPLTAIDAIRVWESGHRQRPAEQALTVLTVVFPEDDQDGLRRLTLGACNARLLKVRDQIFGHELVGFSECVNCGERLEFTLDSKALSRAGPVEAPEAEFELECEGYSLRFRLLEIEDLIVAGEGGDQVVARDLLIERCIVEARYDDREVLVASLPDTVVAYLGQRLTELDSAAEVEIELSCPACDCINRLSLDVAAYFNAEIAAQAQRLLREVHTLAVAYGWNESDILAMSALRRRSYIEMLER